MPNANSTPGRPRSRSLLESTNVRDPELISAIEKRPFPEFPPGGPIDSREARAAHLRRLRHLMPVPGPIPEQVIETEHSVPSRDGEHAIGVTIYTPASFVQNGTTNNSNAGKDNKGPLIILFHEGGWSQGDLTDEEFNARIFSRDLGATCINVEYRLAPEYPFPIGVQDCWDVVAWAAKTSTSLSPEPSSLASLPFASPDEHGFILGGSSAGGNLSAVISRMWNWYQAIRLSATTTEPGNIYLYHRSLDCIPTVPDTPYAPITGQWLSVPYLFPPHHIPKTYLPEFLSSNLNKIDPVLKDLSEEAALGLLQGVLNVDMDSPWFSVLAPLSPSAWRSSSSATTATATATATPILTPAEMSVAEGDQTKLKDYISGFAFNVPRTYFQVAGLDPLRDHALVYERILRDEFAAYTKTRLGGEVTEDPSSDFVKLDLYPGFGHMFWTNWPEMEQSKKFAEDTLEGMRWLLKK